MRILVTGGAGFIGSNLVDALLATGNSVSVIDDLSTGAKTNLPDSVPFFEQDIRDAQGVQRVMESIRPDVVLHQAAQASVGRSVREPELDAQINVLGTLNVSRSAVATGVKKFLFASSGGVVYGETTVPASEESPLNPISPYGISKLAGEQYLNFLQKQSGMTTICLRYANVYGEGQNPNGDSGVVAIFCHRMFRGETPTIRGDGKSVRDYVHISDVVEANLLALNADLSGFEAINIGTGIGTELGQLVGMIRNACQSELRRRGIQRAIPEPAYGPDGAGELRSDLVSIRKAQSLLGWQPKIRIEEGIERTAAWFADQILTSPDVDSDLDLS